MIRERPPQSSVVALLEAEGLPISDLTQAHLEHFFFTASDGAPTAIQSAREFASLCPTSSAFMIKQLNPTGEQRAQPASSAAK